ncbi:hypothetical protein EJ08DRAFT_126066 [Tothia fuscella]|uniref:Transmembrane protein n=1 Tax=Tothia fuscella TaxID=1048955 RepID=A0A9P4NVW3_9PEZI|nr:hypothetical protein EJ08DRAFT_126066 [Tothia fuscella]
MGLGFLCSTRSNLLRVWHNPKRAPQVFVFWRIVLWIRFCLGVLFFIFYFLFLGCKCIMGEAVTYWYEKSEGGLIESCVIVG